MNLYSIESKKYKTIFFQILVVNSIAVIGAFALVKNGLFVVAVFDAVKKLTSPILLGMIVLAAFHAQRQRKLLNKINDISDFDLRVDAYEKFYKFRMLWFLFSCLTSCFLTILTGRFYFLYFALFDILVMLPLYPKPALFKRELNNDEIMVY